jgi:hypothetical protein
MQDVTYCFEQCKIGKAASETFLELNNSAFDAVIDFRCFVNSCSKTCPYKQAC